MSKIIAANMNHFCVSCMSIKPNALSVSHWNSPEMQADSAGPHVGTQKQKLGA